MDSPLAEDPEAMRRAVEPIFAAPPAILCAHLFGSRASGEHGTLSDIDLAYFSRVPLSMREEADLLYELGRALGTHEVDLVNLRSMPLRKRLETLEEGRLLYVRSPEALADLLATTRQEYFDFLPLEREYDAAFLQNLRERLP